jgi:hypothetical protein
MRRTSVSASSGFVLFCVFLLPLLISRGALHAQTQAPAAGTSVTVRMIDGVDSQSDPPGKQYRASVANAVDGGNGVRIPQGAIAAVALVKSGSGWTTQIVSVTINGQIVAVASAQASVASGQAAASSTASAVNSVLHGIGHRANAPAGITAIATGQRVVLPPGTTLTFVLTQPPASNSGASTAPIPSAAPIVNSSAEQTTTPSAINSVTSANSGGRLSAMNICFSNPPPTPSDPNHKTKYLTAVFEVPVDTEGAIPEIEPAFAAYLKATYQYQSAGITCQPIWSVADAQTAQKKIISDRDTAKLKIVDTGWRYGQPALSPGQSGFDPLAQGSGGLDLSQHRLTTYFCTLKADGGTTWVRPPGPLDATRYVSPIFQADWDSVAVSNAWSAYIRDHYVHDLDAPVNGATFGSGANTCNAQSPAMQTMIHPGSLRLDKQVRHIVTVDWTYTPAQAAAAHVATAPAAAQVAATASSAGGPFVSCATSGGAAIDTYLTGVFQTKLPVRHLPNGGVLVDQSILDRFYAYLTQKGYNFKPGSNYACDVKPTEAEAKAAQHKRHYEGGGCSNCGKIVETGWKDTQ